LADNLVRNVLDAALRLAGGADPKKRARAREALDRAQRSWAEKSPWPALRRWEEFTHPGGRTLSLPERVWVILSVLDSNSQTKIEPVEHWDRLAPEVFIAGTAGTPSQYRKLGVLPVAGQPATDTPLELHTTGSEAYTVRVHGLKRDSSESGSPHEFYEDREAFVMGGTTATQTAGTWVSIAGLEKDEGTEYDFKAVDPTTQKVLARIPSWQARAQYPTIEFLPVPAAGTPIVVEYLVAPDEVTSEEAVLDAGISREYLEWQIAGDVLWATGRREDAMTAWGKAEQILSDEARKNTTLGEGDFRAIPGETYLQLEDYYGGDYGG
jgi:hypothetical protein